MKKIPVLVICAPTATGKTEFLLSFFNKNTHEVISADSLQIYKELKIGTAKPSPEERARLPHHLVDCIDPKEEFGSGDFVRHADEIVKDIRARGKMVIVSGGTGFFIKNFLYGLPPTPKADADIRGELQRRVEVEGAEALYNELLSIDKERAEKLHPNDTYRVVRALEVYYTSGKTLTSFEQTREFRPQYRFRIVHLVRERATLYERINDRVEAMFARGLWNELVRLTEERDVPLTADDPSMTAIGYKEFFIHARNVGKKIGDFSPDDCREVKEMIKTNTRHYAKRQIVFFKSLPCDVSIDMDKDASYLT